MFFHEIEELRSAMINSGHWSNQDIEAGRRHGLVLLRSHLKRMEERKAQVTREINALFETQLDSSPDEAIDIGSANALAADDEEEEETVSLKENCSLERSSPAPNPAAPAKRGADRINRPQPRSEKTLSQQCKEVFQTHGHRGIQKFNPKQREALISAGLITNSNGILRFSEKLAS
jgi:hypothetical protein